MSAQRRSLQRLFSFMKPFRWKLLCAILLALVGTGLNASLPLFISWIIDYITKNISYGEQAVQSTIDYAVIYQRIIQIIVVMFIAQLGSYFANRFIATVIQETMRHLRSAIAEKINRLPIAFFDKHQQGDILSRITNDIDNIGNALQQGLLPLVNAIFTLCLVLIILAFISWQVMLFAFIIIPCSLFLARFIVKRSQRSFNELQASLGTLNGFIQEDYSGFEIIKLYGREAISEQQFANIIDQVTEHGFRGNFLTALINPLSGLFTYGGYILVALYGAYLIIDGNLHGTSVMTIGLLQACTQYVWQISEPVSQIIEIVPGMQIILAAATRVFDMLDEPIEVETHNDIHFPTNIKGNVKFNHVGFSYAQDKPVIRDLSFDIKKGQIVAIVGPTGAGKTTIVNLLMRFYDITSGAILLDNISTSTVARAEVREQFGMVLQDAWLYQASIRDNIRFGRLDATDKEIIEAAKIANAHAFILELPEGYDTILNEETSNISQGQKQLLTIARAVLSEPKILILDEATSSVDTRIELLIQNGMQNIMRGRTSFIIAHRLSTIKNADLILVIRDGAIIEQGTHEALLRQKGFYEELYNSQFVE